MRALLLAISLFFWGIILDLQMREAEAGRIRFGNKKTNDKGKEIPHRLDHPLLTSPDKSLIQAVASGPDGSGKVEHWTGDEGQWQTEVLGELHILVPVSPEPFTQWWERWSGGGCLRRCNGVRDTINDIPCDCDKESDKRACSATTRFIVLVPETGDARWRGETKSLIAALSIPGALAPAVGEKTGEAIAGVLRVEQRRGKKGTVPVPVITLNGSGAAAALEAGVAHAPVARVESPESAGHDGSGDSPPKTITAAQIARLMAISNAKKVSEGDLKLVVKDMAGVTSRKLIPVDRYDELISAIEGLPDPEPEDALFAPEREDVG